MKCIWCSNPEGMALHGGSEYSVSEIFDECKRSKLMFFSGGGVTFTGGEATMQHDELLELFKLLKAENIHIAIETNGTSNKLENLLEYVDYLIMDFKHYDSDVLKKYPDGKDMLVNAIKNNFEGYDDLREFLLSCPKFGNNIEVVDNEARDIAIKVSDMLRSKKNYLGNSFRPDFSSPSTRLTYGYWVGATPDGRKSRDMLGYGVDPLYGEASNGLGFRILSNMKLPFEEFNGGYASHLGVDPKYFKGDSYGKKGIEFYNNIIKPLFFNELKEGVSPFYLYVNVTTPETLRKVLADPEKYVPSGVYIMRIHGTFVNFLDLSPEIQQDIITRLDLKSTSIGC